MKKTLLLLLVVMFLPVAASAQLAQAYIVDNKGDLTNIRNAPNGKVVATLPTSGAYVVTLISVKNGWWKIDDEVEEYGDDPKTINLSGSRTGYWIHQSLLMATTAGVGFSKLYASPSPKSRVVFKGDKYLELQPIDIKGSWLKMKSVDGNYTGWIQADHLCTNPLTTCP